MEWLLDKQLFTGDNIQNLSNDIALHLLHILEQYARGFLAGVNTIRWKSHVFICRQKVEVLHFYFIILVIFSILYFFSLSFQKYR